MSIAILFPGQGSQSVGMMKAFADTYPLVRQRFQQASDLIGIDLWDIAQNDTSARLNSTEFTQPILLTAGVVSYEILKTETGIQPSHMAGHSLGEYTALCAAGAISFEDAVRLVNRRGQLMQEAVPSGQGAMAAILGLSDRDVALVCSEADGEVFPANYNAPGQVVIAGAIAAVKQAMELAKDAGAKRAITLPVSVPSHCPLMRAAAAKLSLYLDKVHWKMPSLTIIYNVDAATRHDIIGIKTALGAQLYQPVRWSQCVQTLAKEGVTQCVEAAPGKVLSGLVKRIDKTLAVTAFDSPETLPAIRDFLEAK